VALTGNRILTGLLWVALAQYLPLNCNVLTNFYDVGHDKDAGAV
jgi:hypothetical protein